MSEADAHLPLLEYELRSNHPTRIGNRRLRVDRDGSIWAQQNRQEPHRSEWESEWQARGRLDDADTRLSQLLEQAGFFTLAPHYESPATGGARETLCYRGTRGARSVTVERVQVAEFRKVVTALVWGLGVGEELS